MANLPFTRPSNPTSGEPVPSGAIAEIMDAIIAGAKNVSSRTFKSGSALQATNWAFSGGGVTGGWTSSAAGSLYLAVPNLEQGDRVKTFKVRAQGDGSVDVTYTLAVVRDDVATTIATLVDNNRAAAWGDAVLAFSSGPYTLAANEWLVLIATANAANAKVLHCTYSWDRPLP